MPETDGDPFSAPCYHLLSGSGIRESQRLDPDPSSLAGATRAGALRTKARQPARPATGDWLRLAWQDGYSVPAVLQPSSEGLLQICCRCSIG